MDDVIMLSSDSEATVLAGAAARRRAAREALAARRAAKKLTAAAAKKLAMERAAHAKKLAKQRVDAREAAAGTRHFLTMCFCIPVTAAACYLSIAVHIGPNINGNKRFDQYCMFPNRVALVQTQVNRLNEVAMERPTRKVYVFTIVGANIDEQRAKMVKYLHSSFSPSCSLRSPIILMFLISCCCYLRSTSLGNTAMPSSTGTSTCQQK